MLNKTQQAWRGRLHGVTVFAGLRCLCFHHLSGAISRQQDGVLGPHMFWSQSQCPICQAIKAAGEQDNVSELLENIPLESPAGEMPEIGK